MSSMTLQVRAALEVCAGTLPKAPRGGGLGILEGRDGHCILNIFKSYCIRPFKNRMRRLKTSVIYRSYVIS